MKILARVEERLYLLKDELRGFARAKTWKARVKAIITRHAAGSPENKHRAGIGCLTFRCNICGSTVNNHMSRISRENPSCPGCGSTVRMRAMIHALSMELFGESLVLPDFPTRKDLTGIGMSDWDGYALPLAEKLSYTNTYYHQEPFLDITAGPGARAGSLDFILSSDVYEHVLHPVQIAFDNARRLLKPGGVFIFSVPYKLEGDSVEHFPELHDFDVRQENGDYRLYNTTRNGRRQVFSDLIFHGGPGSTLEMRVFSERALARHFQQAGFREAVFYTDNCFEYGIFWKYFNSLPIAGRTAPAVPRRATLDPHPKVHLWSPDHTVAGQGFNLQPDGSSALWMQGEYLDLIAQLSLADTPLPGLTVSACGYALSASVPACLLGAPALLPLHARLTDGDVLELGALRITAADSANP